MHQFVQSAIEAANRGDKNKAIDFLKQALAGNPNDVDAWLALATVVDEPDRKRQCLNRVLALDPVNQIARGELLKLDRLAMGGVPVQTDTPQPQKHQSSSPPSTISPNESRAPAVPATIKHPASTPVQTEPISASQKASSLRIDKPVIFRYPARGRIGYFVIAAIFGCIGLLAAAQSSLSCIPPLGMALLFGLAALSNQSSVTISEAGIQINNLLSKAKINWSEIVSLKSNALSKKLELIPNKGNPVNISTQIEGYPVIVEILRQKRPDLFGISARNSTQNSTFAIESDNSTSMNISSAKTPAFIGAKAFKKNFFAQYGVLLLMLPLCVISPLVIYFNNDWFAGIGLGLIGLFFMATSLFNVNEIKLEANKLTAESFFSQKELTAKQIREITMKTQRSRRGVATNFINIQPVEGNAIALAGFPEGDEIIYGTLMDWWSTYKNR